jgi:hypothetical protein
MKSLKILTFCIISFTTIAQEKFYSGAIIQTNGDTLKGYISNIYDAKKIEFKTSKNAKKTILTPGQIKGFLLFGNTYKSKFVNINEYDKSKYLKEYPTLVKNNFLEKRRDVTTYTDSVFVQQLVNGKISLYKLTTKKGRKAFYAENESKIIEIPPVHYVYKKDSTLSDGFIVQNGVFNRIVSFSGTYTQQKVYLDSLQSLMQNVILPNNSYRKEMEESFRQDYIVLYVEEYNAKFQQTSTVLVDNKSIRKINFGFNIGTIIPTYEPNLKDFNTSLSSLKSRAYSVFILIPFSGVNRNLSFRIGYQLYGYNVATTVNSQLYGAKVKNIRGLSLGVRYAAVKGLVRPFIGISISSLRQTINKKEFAVQYSLLPEAGAIVSIKKINIVAQANIFPLLKSERFGFQFSTFSLGLIL